MERVVHVRRVRPGVFGAEQVGAPDRPDQQRYAGQQQERLLGARRVGDGIADVLGRVPRSVERPEPDRAHAKGGSPSAAGLLLVGEMGARTDDVRRPGQRCDLATARDVVVVQVRFDHVGDAQICRARSLGNVDVDVAARVHEAAATPAASSATSVDRWPRPSILYCVTRTAAVYTGHRVQTADPEWEDGDPGGSRGLRDIRHS